MTNRALGLIPIDLSDRITEAYGQRHGFTAAILTETVGLAVVLLVNRNTSPLRALPPNRLRNPHIDSALCEAAEAFAAEIGHDFPAAQQSWRGGGLAGLRMLAPHAVEDTGTGLWVREERMIFSVGEWLAGETEADSSRAFDMAVWKFRSQCGPLAAGGSQHETPDLTASLKAALLALPPPGPPLFDPPAAATELLGQQVRVTLALPDGATPARITDGQLLGFSDHGGFQVLDDNGAVQYCWPMLAIGPRPEATGEAGND